MIKAIQTRYKGYNFRSRLEARWAVFFDACGYQWEYEPEGFDLGETWYLPDFKIFGEDKNGDYNVFYIEVKASEDRADDLKIKAFREALWKDKDREDWWNRILKGYGDFIVLDGPPANKLYYGTFPFNGDESQRQWLMEDVYRGRPSFWNEWGEWNPFYSNEIQRMDGFKSPVEIALSARFEHGENPCP